MMRSVEDELVRLQQALIYARDVRRDSSENQRIAAILEINAIFEFIEKVDILKERDLGRAIAFLGSDLTDLDAGIVPHVLKPAKSSGGRPKDSAAWAAIKGHAAATMGILMRFESRSSAARLVANVLKDEGVSLDGRIELTGATVAGWRDHIKGSDQDMEARVTYDHVMDQLKALISFLEAHQAECKDPSKRKKLAAAIVEPLQILVRSRAAG